jgi:hypothetical protein
MVSSWFPLWIVEIDRFEFTDRRIAPTSFFRMSCEVPGEWRSDLHGPAEMDIARIDFERPATDEDAARARE